MSDDDGKIEEEVRKALTKIRSMTDAKSLVRLYKNVMSYSKISDAQEEELCEAIEHRLREISPAKATKLFGPKDAESRGYLDGVFAKLSEDFDFTDNRVRNGVKIGGDMIAGRKHIDVYISYKNEDGWNVGLSWLQDEPGTEAYLRLRQYQHGVSNEASLKDRRYELVERDSAVEAFRKKLEQLLQGGSLN